MDQIDDFYDDMRLNGYSLTTLQVYRDRLRAMPPEALDDLRAARRWLLDRHDNGLSLASVAGYTKALKAYSRWRAEEYGADDVMAALKFPKLAEAPAQRIASDDDVDKVLRELRRGGPARFAANSREIALLTLFRDTGCRRGEAMALKVTDVDLDGGMIVFPRTKAGRSRSVPITHELSRALRNYLRQRAKNAMADSSDALWLGAAGPLKSESITKIFRLMSKRAGLEVELRPHQLRRRLASKWLSAGGADDTLMAVAGWSSRSMPALYRRAHIEQLAAEQFKAIMDSSPAPTMRIKPGRRPQG